MVQQWTSIFNDRQENSFKREGREYFQQKSYFYNDY